MLEKLVKPFIESGVKAITNRGEQTVGHEVSGIVAKDVVRTVITADTRLVSEKAAKALAAKKLAGVTGKEVAAVTTKEVAAAAGKDVAKDVIAELPKAKIKTPVTLVAEELGWITDAPRPSRDGKSVAYSARKEQWLPEWFKKLIGLPEDQAPETVKVFIAAADGKTKPQKIVGRTFKNAAQPAYSPKGDALLFVEQKHILGGGERLQEMRLNQVDLKTGKVSTLWDGKPSLLHPQYSPDGKKIALYSRTPGHEGLYLMDPANPANAVRLTTAHDKHPVWNTDGTRLYFHSQTGGNSAPGSEELEKAFIGYLDMTDPKAPKRVMLDALDDLAPTYHKHPAPVPNSDLVAYHVKTPDSNNTKIEVLDTVTGRRARLSLEGTSPTGVELKEFRHPAFSDDGQSLLVAAKGSKKDAAATGAEETWRIYKLDGAQSIIKAFEKAFEK